MHTARVTFCFLTVLNLLAAILTIAVKDVYCDFMGGYCAPGFCKYTLKSGQDTGYYSAGCNVAKPMQTLTIKTQLYRYMHNKYKAFGPKFQQSLCDMENMKKKNYFVERLLSFSMKYVANFKCPLKGNITITNLPFKIPIIEGFFPPASYIYNCKVYTGKNQMLEMNATFEIT